MWKTASRRSSPKCSKSSFWVVRGGGFIGRKESGMPHSFCMIHTTKGKKVIKRNLFLSPSLIFLIGKNKFVKNPRTFYFSKTGHEKREIRPVSQASTLFKIFIFCPKIQLWFRIVLGENSWKCCGFWLFSCRQLWFHEKNCQKKFWVKNLWKCWVFLSKFNFWRKIWLFEYSGVPNKRTGTLINFQKKCTLVRSY